MKARPLPLDPRQECARQKGEKNREKWQADEGVCDRSMIFHDAERIARQRLRENVHIGENRAERRGKNGDSLLALGEKSLAEERARDSVSYRIHEGFKTAEVYTIQRVSAT